MAYSKNTKCTKLRSIYSISGTGSCDDVNSKQEGLSAKWHYHQKGESLTILILFQLLSPPIEHTDKICSQKSGQELRYIFLHKKSRIIISLQQLTPNNPWELCNWMLLGLFWACKIEPVVLSAVYHYLSSARLVPHSILNKGQERDSPFNHWHHFWKR